MTTGMSCPGRTHTPWPNCGFGESATPRLRKQLQPRIESNLAKRHDDADASEVFHFRVEMIQAARDLFRQWLVVGRGAADRRQDVCIVQPQPVIRVPRRGDVCETRPMKG